MGQGSEWKSDKIKRTKPTKGSFKHGVPIGGTYGVTCVHQSILSHCNRGLKWAIGEHLVSTYYLPGLGQERERERKNQAECGYPPDNLSTMPVSICVSVSTPAPGTQSGVKEGGYQLGTAEGGSRAPLQGPCLDHLQGNFVLQSPRMKSLFLHSQGKPLFPPLSGSHWKTCCSSLS